MRIFMAGFIHVEALRQLLCGGPQYFKIILFNGQGNAVIT